MSDVFLCTLGPLLMDKVRALGYTKFIASLRLLGPGGIVSGDGLPPGRPN
jgi:hypothetical protein